MFRYITIVYQGENNHPEFGWEFGKIILFQSGEYDNPGDAMQEFNNSQLPDKAWFAYMRVTKNGEIFDEEMFDTSTAKVE